MIKVEKLNKTYQVGDKKIPVLKDISLTITDNEFSVVMGESGCGKSTFLSCISGLSEITSGQILLDDLSLHDKKNKAMEEIRLKKFGFIFQDNYMIDNLTVLENVCMSRLQYDPNAYELGRSLLASMHIEQLADKYPSQVSGGEKQRAAIARAMINQPDILFADEPTASLDHRSASDIMEIFKHLNEQGQCILMVTHSAQIAAYGTRIMIMEDGVFYQDEPLGKDRKANVEKIRDMVKDIL